jgi:electron transfer flavoprotein beta subunit
VTVEGAVTVKVAVLVSVGRHPASARPRRADADARAVELALGLPGATLSLTRCRR